LSRKRKRRTGTTVLRVILALVIISVVTFLALKIVTDPPAAIRYKEFGIPIPSGFTIHGIDVSHYQRRIAWKEVKDMQVRNIRIGFAFIKATEGTDRIDPQFRRNWVKAEEVGLPRGAYHFFHPARSARAQALNFIETVNLKTNDLPPVLDVETTNGRSTREVKEKVKEWLDIVEAHYGVRPIIYTNADFYEKQLGDEFNRYPLWVAHYFQPVAPRIGRKWQFWQHSERGRVNGIRGAVDFNVFNGDGDDFYEMLVK
jgi:lysozyme